jgi:hypothetical protein
MFAKHRRHDLLGSIEPVLKGLIRKGLDADAAVDKVAKAVGQAVPGAVEESAQAVVANLHRRVSELSEHRKLDRAFKRRLAITWKRPFLLYEMVLTCAAEAGADFNDARRADAAKARDFRFDALTMLHSRACLVASENLELMKGGYPFGAHARGRTLHELAVFASVIGEHNQELSERFLLHTAVEDASFVDSYQKNIAGKYGYEPYSHDEVANVKTRRDSAIKRFGRGFNARYGWAADLFPKPPTFGELEQLAGLNHLRPFYDWATHLGVHASSRGARLNIVKRGRDRVMLAGRTNAFMADPGHGALISLLQTTTTLLLRGRPLDGDLMPLIVARAIQKLTDEAGDAFLEAHKKLDAKERAFRKTKR